MSNLATDTVQYNSGFPGPRSVNLIVDGVPYPLANIVNIKEDFSPPEIISSNNIICAGDAINLSASTNASSYQWSIPGGSISTYSQQNPGSVSFASPGQYEIELSTTSC